MVFRARLVSAKYKKCFDFSAPANTYPSFLNTSNDRATIRYRNNSFSVGNLLMYVLLAQYTIFHFIFATEMHVSLAVLSMCCSVCWGPFASPTSITWHRRRERESRFRSSSMRIQRKFTSQSKHEWGETEGERLSTERMSGVNVSKWIDRTVKKRSNGKQWESACTIVYRGRERERTTPEWESMRRTNRKSHWNDDLPYGTIYWAAYTQRPQIADSKEHCTRNFQLMFNCRWVTVCSYAFGAVLIGSSVVRFVSFEHHSTQIKEKKSKSYLTTREFE